jgi:branched-chain amino acid aminotransferase
MSQTFTFLDGKWIEGNQPIVGLRTHAFWLGSSVFDGARAFEGVTPDLDKHCARLNRSARTMGLKPTMSDEAIMEVALEGVKMFRSGAELYVRQCIGPKKAPWAQCPCPIRSQLDFASVSMKR